MYVEEALLSDERLRSHRLLEIPLELVENEECCASEIDVVSYMEEASAGDDNTLSKREQSNSNDDELMDNDFGGVEIRSEVLVVSISSCEVSS